MHSSRLAAVVVVLSLSSFAQNLRVVPVPQVATDPTVPHAAYNGKATTFKAIARGGNGTYLYEWDFQGDGVYDFSATTTNRYNLSTRFTFPNQASDLTFAAKVRVTSNGQTVIGTYPVHVYADVPQNPANANDRQLQVMRDVAVDDGLWWLHNQMARSGNEEDPLTGAQITGNVGGIVSLSAGLYLEALGRARHWPAFPAAYIGPMPNPADNAARWANDPYAEDAARLANFLLTQAMVVSVTTADESNLVGFYPEVTANPIAGTDDGIGLFVGSSGTNWTGYHAAALRGLSVARLTGYVAQTGDSNRILGRRFEFVVQQLVDALVWAQTDSGYVGSWGYSANDGFDMLAEYAGGFADSVDGLWVAEQAMARDGVIVPNFVKARALQYVQVNINACPEGGTGGSYSTSYNGVCDFAMSAAHLFALGWVGAGAASTTDTRLAFPSYNGFTRGQLRTMWDSSLVYINNTFLTGGSSTSLNWDLGFVPGGNFLRTDGQGDHWSMFRWARAARAQQPELARYGTNDWWRLFSSYFVVNQASDGSFNWVQSSMNDYNDNIVSGSGRSGWALLTLLPTALPPLLTVTTSTTTAPEGSPLTFTAVSSVPGAVSWNFGAGPVASGASISKGFPDNGTFTVTATVTTADGMSDVVSLPVTITNVAPLVNAGTDQVVDEGALVSFSGTLSDPGTADTHVVSWSFGDTATASTLAAQHAYADNGVFTARLGATDDDGDAASDTATITVRNVAPTLTSTPTPLATTGAAWSYTLAFTDPGPADTHTCSAPTKPAGATLSGCTLSWTPSSGGSSAFRACVTDDDGAATCQDFVVTAAVVDTDADGLPDAWEMTAFGGLNQAANGDPDGDGVSNRDEYLAGTNPSVFDGPSAPTATACNGTVADPRPTLTVTNATDPQATPLSYEFEVYADAMLTNLVVAATGVTAGATSTSWRLPLALTEDTRYYWRARAHDATSAGAWTMPACAFLVDATNALPGAPTLDAPADGSRVATARPQLTVGNAVDLEGDALTYEFELFVDGVRSATQQGVAEGTGTTSWQPPSLVENTAYTWHARAVSAGGAGPWSPLGRFQVNAANTAPPPPVLVTPQQGTTVETRTPELLFLAVGDADGDAVTYDWELAADERFLTPLASGADVTTTALTVTSPLAEDAKACWRVRSDDGQAQSPWVRACFFVSTLNDAPNVPTPGNPSDGSVVATVTPVFSWAPAVDPEGAPVSYELELSSDGAVVATSSGVSGNAALFAQPLVDGKSYQWRVRATTSEGPASAFSAASSFSVKLPEAPQVVAPKQGCTSAPGPLWLVAAGLALLRARRRAGP